MNRTVIYMGILGLVAIMFIGIIVLVIFNPDAASIIIAFAGSTLTTIIGSAVILYNLGKTNEKVDRVERQTNGTNTALLAVVTGKSESEIETMKGNN